MRTLGSRLLAGVLVLALAVALVPSAGAQKRGGTLTIVRPTDPVSLDPNLETTAPGAWVYFNMLEGLLTLDDKMQVKPLLATSYEVMSPTRVRFKLRPGVKFHDGTPVNAAALQTGDADMVLFPSPAQLPALRKDSKYTVHETTGIRVVFAGMHAGLPPLDDVHVRQAMLYAVDRKAILDNIMEGSAGPARGVLAPGVFGYKDMQLDRLYPFDRAKARALLGQAGWTPGPDGIMTKGGQRLSLSWLAARGRYPKDGEITEAIQAMFKEVGVEAKVQILEWGAVFQQVRGNPLNHHMFTLGWVTSNADADYSLYALFHSKQVPPAGWNTSRYSNPRVDTLVEQARRSLNQTEREKLYGEVQDIVAKEMVWIPVYTTKEIIASRANVKGFHIHPVEYNLTLSKTWIDK